MRFSIHSGVHLVWDSCILRELFSYIGQKFSFGVKVPARVYVYMGSNYFLNDPSWLHPTWGHWEVLEGAGPMCQSGTMWQCPVRAWRKTSLRWRPLYIRWSYLSKDTNLRCAPRQNKDLPKKDTFLRTPCTPKYTPLQEEHLSKKPKHISNTNIFLKIEPLNIHNTSTGSFCFPVIVSLCELYIGLWE